MKRLRNNDNKRGPALLPIVIVVVAAVIAIGGGLFAWKYLASQKTAPDQASLQIGQTDADLSEMTISLPQMDLSASPIETFDMTALDLGLSIDSDILQGLTVSQSVGYSGTIDLTQPTVSVGEPDMAGVSVSGPPSSGSGSSGSSSDTGDAGDTGDTGDTGQSAVNASNCAQFSAMPSAQYCTAVSDSNGRSLCEQCKTAGY